MQQITNKRGSIVLGSTKSDPHVVPIYLTTMFLEEHGYDVLNMRCGNSAEAFVGQAVAMGADAIVISNNNGAALEDLADLDAVKARHGCTIPVLLGGHFTAGFKDNSAEKAQLRARGVDAFPERIEDLLDLVVKREAAA